MRMRFNSRADGLAFLFSSIRGSTSIRIERITYL